MYTQIAFKNHLTVCSEIGTIKNNSWKINKFKKNVLNTYIAHVPYPNIKY